MELEEDLTRLTHSLLFGGDNSSITHASSFLSMLNGTDEEIPMGNTLSMMDSFELFHEDTTGTNESMAANRDSLPMSSSNSSSLVDESQLPLEAVMPPCELMPLPKCLDDEADEKESSDSDEESEEEAEEQDPEAEQMLQSLLAAQAAGAPVSMTQLGAVLQRLQSKSITAKKQQRQLQQQQQQLHSNSLDKDEDGLNELVTQSNLLMGHTTFGKNSLKQLRKAAQEIEIGSRSAIERLPAEAARQLGRANQLYAQNRSNEAIAPLLEAIRLAPNAFEAYRTLALIHEDAGDIERALPYYMIAAHLTPRDADAWTHAAYLSRQQRAYSQSVYCYTKALKQRPQDTSLLWSRAHLDAALGNVSRAIESLEKIQLKRPMDLVVARQLCQLWRQENGQQKAAAHYEGVLRAALQRERQLSEKWEKYQKRLQKAVTQDEKQKWLQPMKQLRSQQLAVAAVSLEHVEYLSQLLLELQAYALVRSCIETYALLVGKKWAKQHQQEMQDEEYLLDETLSQSISLRGHLTVSLIYLEEWEEASREYEKLESVADSIEKDSILLAIAEAYQATGQRTFAAPLYEKLYQKSFIPPSISLFRKMGRCRRAIQDLQGAQEMFERVLNLQATCEESILALMEIYEQLGDHERALSMAMRVTEQRQSKAMESLIEVESEADEEWQSAFTLPTKKSIKNIVFSVPLSLCESNYQSYQQSLIFYDQGQFALFLTVTESLLQDFLNNRFASHGKRISTFISVSCSFGCARYWDEASEEMREREWRLLRDEEDCLKQVQERIVVETSSSQVLKRRALLRRHLHGLDLSEWMHLLILYCDVLCSQQQLSQAYSLVSKILEQSSSLFQLFPKIIFKLKSLCLIVSWRLKNWIAVLEHLRFFISRCSESKNVHVLLLYAISQYKETCSETEYDAQKNRWPTLQLLQKFMLRQIKKCQKVPLLWFIYGHVMRLTAPSLIFAMAYYYRAHVAMPREAVILHCLSTTTLQYAVQKQVTVERHSQVLMALSWMHQYAALIEESDPLGALYNQARACQQLGCWSAAMKFYQRVLSTNRDECTLREQWIQKASALMLQQIYVLTGNAILAMQITKDWLTV